MKIKTYICICWSEFTKSNSLQKTCWKVKCKLEQEKQKREEKAKKLSIQISWVDNKELREELRSDIQQLFPKYIWNKKITVKVGKGKIKSESKKLKDKLDKIFAEYIRLRDNKTCVICGSTENPNNWHYFSRVCSILRWNEINCNCQCAKCNFLHEQDEKPYTDWMIKKYWKIIVNELRLSYYWEPMKIYDEYLKIKTDHYTEEVKRLKLSDNN